MTQLAVLIAARNEEWLARTVHDVLAHAQADTEVVVVLDGAWANPPLEQQPKVSVIYVPESIGQRAAVNLAARVTDAEYVMKLDAHCSVAPGFDVALITAAQELEPGTCQVPAQKNLHVFDWVCDACGRREYQGPTPAGCRACGQPVRRDIVWQPRRGVHTTAWRFDSDLKFQYWGDWKPTGELTDTMSCLGACWFQSRERFLALGGLDEAHGSWGQVGTELACKNWLSGGRLVTNHRTWFAHLFRTQGGDFSFPYPISGHQTEHARAYSRKLWRNNKWDGQVYPLRWLVDKFWPVPGWTEEQRDQLASGLGRADVDLRPVSDPSRAPAVQSGVTKGIVYYSDGRLDPRIAAAVLRTMPDLPFVGTTLAPYAEAPYLITLPLERGYLTMFKQILVGLELSDAEVIYFCEHDVLYSPSHFECLPSDRSRVLYNTNVWKVSSDDGRALHYRCAQTSGLIGYRDVLLAHYRQRVALVEHRGFTRAMGFEPGTHRRPERVDDLESETCLSAVPNVDIRHDKNLTPSRWSKEQFRNQKYTEGWTESDAVPGWGVTKGRFWEFLAEVTGVQQAVA